MEFMLGGNSYVTLRSQKTGNRYTYRIVKRDDGMTFVSYLAGSDNRKDYIYLGMIVGDLKFTPTAKSPPEGDPHRAFRYAWRNLVLKQRIAPDLEIWHEGRCGRCGRMLTTPESIERGFGEDCWNFLLTQQERSGRVSE